MNILIINAHSSLNKGDAGIILSMINSIKKHLPDSDFIIKTRFPEIDASAYGVKVSASIYNINAEKITDKLTKMNWVLQFILILAGVKRTIDKDYEWADIVVSCGGGFILTHGPISLMTIQHLVQIKTAINYKKPTVIYSQSIGPFHSKLILSFIKNVLNNTTKIFVREEISYQLLKQLKITAPVEVVPDSAFSMTGEETDKVRGLLKDLFDRSKGKPLIGITVRDWNFPEVTNPIEKRNRYKESIVAAILYLENDLEAQCVLMPQVLGPNKFNDDRIISREILNELGTKTKAILLDYDLVPGELKYLYSKMDMFIGTRMHSNIFALTSFIPTVAINYEHKTQGIMEMLQLTNYVLNISDITPASLLSTAKNCWTNRSDLTTLLKQRIPLVIKESEKPAVFISQTLLSKK